MPTVTRLEAQARRADRVNVYLDGTFAFGLALELAAGLRLGQELSAADIERLRAEDDYARALDQALSQLGRRPRSRHELERYLAGKDVSPAVAERVLLRLTELGLVDDAAFAEWWVENRNRHRPRGEQALKQELIAKGIARADQVEALAELDETALALEAALAVAHRYRGLSRDAFDRRLGGLLTRRGFRYEAVRTVLAEVWASQGAGEAWGDETDPEAPADGAVEDEPAY